MFMLQLSFFELHEISAYGFFNINLNIVMSVSIIRIFYYYSNMDLFKYHNSLIQ